MFVGEFDFDDIPMHGGDISVSMAYIFLLAFIFLIVIVIMNLLNGLAVSDTQKMITDSKIESQISFIETIRYFESVYLDTGKIPYIMGKGINEDPLMINKFFTKHVIPMKLFLFHSKYLKGTKTLTLPLESEEIEPTSGSYFLRIKNWLTTDEVNYGCEDFLSKARKILIRLKKTKERERKQRELKGEINILEKRKKFEQLKNETLTDQIRNMENMLQYIISQMSQDYE
jgi:hypothetical protein